MIPYQTLFSGTKFQCEIIHIKLLLKKQIQIINIYRPPNCTVQHTKKLLKFLSDISESKNIVYCGDFNIPNILWAENKVTQINDPVSNLLIEFMDQKQLRQYVMEPTRECAILDLAITNNPELISEIKIHENFSTSDHKMVGFKISEKLNRTRPKVYRRDFKNFNFSKLNQAILENRIDIAINSEYTVGQKYNSFLNKLIELYDAFIPNRLVKSIIKQAYPQKIKDLFSEKLRLHKLIKKFPENKRILLNYKVISRETKKQLNHFKNINESKIISRGQNSVNKFIKNKLSKIYEIPTLIDCTGTIYSSNLQKCKILAEIFQKSFLGKSVNGHEIQSVKCDTKLLDIELNAGIIWNILKRLPRRNSTSPDKIPYILLKNCAEPITRILADIFRLALDSSQIPEIWQTSIVVPIFKKGEKTDPTNYRPISLTSTVCRVLERILSNKILEFLNSTKFFDKDQFGFLKNRSTTTQILKTMDEIYNFLDKKQQIDIIYIDFVKAFDSVPINLLLTKIKNIGIDGKIYNFLAQFLKNRSFKVKIGEDFSESYKIFSGVPQGSVLGPLLFLIFINDLPSFIISEGVSIGIKIYADDVKIYSAHENDEKAYKLVKAIEALEKWSKINGLKISTEKCAVLYLGKNNMKKKYFVNSTEILEVDNIRDLGIIISSKLNFTDHINKIVRNAYLRSFQILRVLKTREIKTLTAAYKTFVRPQLEYATEVWNPNLKKDIDKIERVQKFFTRKAFRKCGFVYKKYKDRLQISGLHKLEERRKIADLTTAFKIIKGFTSLEAGKNFDFSERNRRPLFLRTKRHTYKTQNNFFNRIVKNWNNLPVVALQTNRPKEFRGLLKAMSSE